VPIQQPAAESQVSGLPVDTAPKTSHRFRVVIRFLAQLCSVLASAILSVPYILNDSFISILIVNPYYAHLASRIALVAAMALTAFISARRKTIWIIRIMAVLLLSIEFLVLVIGIIDAVEFGRDPIAMLEATAVGLCGLGIALSPAVFWLRSWVFTEPLATGLLAISLGLLCLPGLSISTAPLLYPSTEGAALLFASGPKDQNILMNITTDPLDPAASGPAFEAPAPEDFVVKNLGKQTIHWALLVTGDARLHIGQSVGFHNSPDLTYRQVAVSAITIPSSVDDSVQAAPPFIPLAEGQLFAGVLPAGVTAYVGGVSFAPFSNSTIDRTAVSLPYYGEGDVSLVDNKTEASILTALHATPSVRGPHFTVNITGGQLGPLQSVTASDPNQAPEVADSTGLNWISHKGIAVSYAAVDQDAVDTNNNLLFVFAILLGAAVAGLLTCLQSLIHILSSRKQTRGLEEVHPALTLIFQGVDSCRWRAGRVNSRAWILCPGYDGGPGGRGITNGEAESSPVRRMRGGGAADGHRWWMPAV
jgi:hypothetical protein